MVRVKTWALAGVAAFFVMPASATIISVTATGGALDANVINNGCGGFEVDGPAPTVTGCLNTDNSKLVDFYSSTGENLRFAGGGQAVVEATDGATSNLTIDPRSFALDELIVDIHRISDAWVKFCDNNGCFATLFQLTSNGANFFDVTFDPAATLLSITTYSNAAGTGDPVQLIDDSRQWRVALGEAPPPCTVNCGPTEVPEPGSLLLLGAGLLGLGIRGRRLRHRA